MDRRFVSIWFPFLLTDWYSRKQPSLRKEAFVLKTASHNRMIVTSVNPLAQAQGITPGMLLADARALYPALTVLDDKPGLDRQLLDRIAEWCIRFTPVSSPDPPAGVLLEASGCCHLWGGEDAYLKDILNRLTQRGYAVRAAIADTVGTAWALARYGKKQIAENGTQRVVLSELPVSSLRLEADAVVRLHKLGLRQVGDVLNLPRTSLRRRFGPGFLLRLQQALGDVEEGLTPVYPEAPYQERLPCIEPIVTRTGIEIALHRLLTTLCSRLRGEGKGLRAAFFRIYRLDGGAQGIEIGTNRPSQNEEHLFQLFSLKLSDLQPAEGIELFLLEATMVEEQKPLQEQLWTTNATLQHHLVAELLDRLAGKLGLETIQRFLPAEHWWPERSFQPAASLSEEPSTEWKLDRPRPLQLLSPPVKIDVTAPVPDYPPMLFRYKNQVHKIVSADGPERIEQEWWVQEGEHRDYYAVEDEAGRRYWLFRLGHYNSEKAAEWFLHGFFA